MYVLRFHKMFVLGIWFKVLEKSIGRNVYAPCFNMRQLIFKDAFSGVVKNNNI